MREYSPESTSGHGCPDAGGWSGYGDDLGDDGGSSGGEDTDVRTLTVTAPVPSFTIAVTATPTTTVVDQGTMTWNGTLAAVNGYSDGVALEGVRQELRGRVELRLRR